MESQEEKVENSKTLQWNYQNICILVVLPVVNMWSMNWIYTAAPLFWLDNDGDLLQYGAIVALGNLGRVLFTANLITFVGDWTAAPFTILLVATSTLLVIYPTGIWSLWLGLGLSNSGELMLCFRGLMHHSLSRQSSHTDVDGSGHTNVDGNGNGNENDDIAVLNRALRVLTISEVISYASGTFIGGVLYEFGGWNSCLWFMLTMHVIQFVVLCSLPVIRRDMKMWLCRTIQRCGCGCGCRCGCEDDHIESSSNSCGEVPEALEMKKEEIKTKNVTTNKDQQTSTAKFPSTIWMPIAMIILSHFTNTAAYSVEWALYAVYFRQSFGWGGSLIGFFQMFGDLIAAAILAGINRGCCCSTKSTTSSTSSACKTWCANLFQPPYNMSILLVLMAMLHVLMAQPIFWCAVLGQIFMGTVWVFGAQIVHEMNVIYSLHNHHRYRRLAWASSVALSLSIAITQFLAIWLYETVDQLLPFWLSALFALLVSLIFTMYFGNRIGCLGKVSLREFEDEKEKVRMKTEKMEMCGKEKEKDVVL